ncbi:MAG: hypothetical protein NZ772_09215 [Cyanobacteria bacterium]|nr:hypothetical protein [Cyanobacteriota bacterium]MDW8201642.1 hypothetical protein [Cyanobacteriota bacterium SKYGB_h_bin112]
MQVKTVWQHGSSNPDNAANFAKISAWWSGLHGKEVTWRQRIVPQLSPPEQAAWEPPQRFDEVFVISNPQVRGITLFWSTPDKPEEKSTTPSKLELHGDSRLYIYLQSQKDVVIQVAIPEVKYDVISLTNPAVQCIPAGAGCILVFKDNTSLVETRIALTADALALLKQQLP